MPSKKLKPLGNKLVVQRQEAKTTKGGILLPESAKEKPRQGTVLSVGPGKIDDKGKTRPLDVKVGDQILFSSYSGTEYKSEDQEYLILSEDDVLAIVN
jgi:chaperonin GroES